MDSPKISVIVPVYNGKKYLSECINSILRQTLDDFELLLIDDGSTDGSGLISDKFAKEDQRIKVIHKSNEGINATRRRGVHEASGEWITFCDDDDTLERNALGNLYALHEDTDIVIGFSVIPQKRISFDASLNDCRHALLAGILPPSPWAKLYRKTLLTDDVFDIPRNIDGEEDMIMNTRIFFKTNKSPHILYKHIYNFRRNTSSLSHTKGFSLRHEELFYKELYKSIPISLRFNYLKQITFLKLNGLFAIAYIHPETLVDKQQDYLQQIVKDAKACKYKISVKEHIILSSHCKVIIKLIGLSELLRRSLIYRFNLLRNKE